VETRYRFRRRQRRSQLAPHTFEFFDRRKQLAKLIAVNQGGELRFEIEKLAELGFQLLPHGREVLKLNVQILSHVFKLKNKLPEVRIVKGWHTLCIGLICRRDGHQCG